MNNIDKVCVIGAGVMGASIAAHIANAGYKVLLLDRVPQGAQNRNVIAEQAVQKLLKSNPAALTHKRNVKLITPLNIEDHLAKIVECDWIIEAIVEQLEIKQQLYKKIDKVRKPGSIVSSNTSTIPLASLTAGMSDKFSADFCISHFFNPPRYMRLLELVKGDLTRHSAIDALSNFADHQLGKSIVHCKDRPGFIANRLGIYWIYCALTEAMDCGLSIEEADAILSKPCGVPKTGVFGLIDLVGLDLMPNILDSLLQLLDADDPLVKLKRELPLLQKMIETGYTGRKGKGGFYRLNRQQGNKVKEAIDLHSGEYHRVAKVDLASAKIKVNNIRQLFETNDKGGNYAWRVMSKTLTYAAQLVPEAADQISTIDEAMRLGYNWKYGPFELIDKLGVDWFIDQLKAQDQPIPAVLSAAAGQCFYIENKGVRQYLSQQGEYRTLSRATGMLMLSDIKLNSSPIIKNASAALWDIGDGVVCFEFTSKMNSLDAQTMQLLQQSIALVKKSYLAMVIYNDAEHFSAGANLGLAMFAANIAAWSEIAKLVEAGQQTYQALKYAPFPVVSAPSGMALGGGCEILLHSDAIQAHIETYTGLVEVAVGLVPAWGGCKEMLNRWINNPKYAKGPMPGPSKAFELISTAAVSKSAEEAKSNLVLGSTDGITMNRYRLLSDAKQKALSMASDYKPPKPPVFHLPGPSGKAAFTMAVEGFVRSGKATTHDRVVSLAAADILSGGALADPNTELTEEDVLKLERDAFMKIIRHPDSLDRVEHMLLTGKPLRN
ncbi:MAG: 3-hydroxyacyl-CoA dehydrogenase NAD-binding domain-containing protein [Pseudomonadales bacterium]|nr:3-hydroxyacyl-CoA dehydrogenase NAD-binding domain-containing protein [Pseudomonadales bacterium]NRA16539.1 enoyl-CoA hydratase/isomerase family protein [Oceanospirillaceae bacterium]